MSKINLREFYPFYHNDLFVEVPDEVAEALAEAERLERNYIRRVYWNKAYFSLDAGDGIEHEALFVALSPCELYERKVTAQELRAALSALPEMQSRRVYAHYILGISRADLARAEGVGISRISNSIDRGQRGFNLLRQHQDRGIGRTAANAVKGNRGPVCGKYVAGTDRAVIGVSQPLGRD